MPHSSVIPNSGIAEWFSRSDISTPPFMLEKHNVSAAAGGWSYRYRRRASSNIEANWTVMHRTLNGHGASPEGARGAVPGGC
jgi:hypothetical protein